MLKVRGPAADACSRYSHDIYVIATRNLQGINVQWNVGGDAPNIYLLYDDPLRLLACVTLTPPYVQSGSRPTRGSNRRDYTVMAYGVRNVASNSNSHGKSNAKSNS